MIDKIHSGKSYHIQGLTVRIFDDIKFLNTNEATVVSEIDDLGDVNLMSQEIQDNIITAHCIGVNIKKSTSCIACNNSLENITPEEETITCPNCKLTTFITISKTKLVCQILLKIDDKMTSYTTFNDEISSFLRIIGNETPVSEIPVMELKKLLLKAGPKKMIIDRSQKLIFQYL
ncbi:ATP-dependent DNA helicase PIF1 [Paramuricea clavata]|uniref:ATP-dependent DNA helicase PIF1 n=1 Tax=Paramuricea clavata TaxID=317549 RepID=A0A6S7LLE9_PARCT|nr:ATP-dependent DNA helicase PIF1 [Paramuricea clavata]